MANCFTLSTMHSRDYFDKNLCFPIKELHVKYVIPLIEKYDDIRPEYVCGYYSTFIWVIPFKEIEDLIEFTMANYELGDFR